MRTERDTTKEKMEGKNTKESKNVAAMVRMDARLAFLLVKRILNQMMERIRHNLGEKNNKTPPALATPFPPLPLR